MRIGIDFDNTIASYDALFATLALASGLIEARPSGGKRAVRDEVRARAGDHAWQRLQAAAYGRHMAEAELIPGAARFLATSRGRDIEVHIVSHKTRRAAGDPDGVDLRAASARWMGAHGFFDESGLAFDRERVHFEDSRAAKLSRIAELGLSHFIDDLEEVLLDPGFPRDVAAILYRPEHDRGEAPRDPRIAHRGDWGDIQEYLLGPDA